MTVLANFFIGFSIIVTPLLLFGILKNHNERGMPWSVAWGAVFLVALASIQILNFLQIQGSFFVVGLTLYKVILYLVAPSFLLFSQSLLYPKTPELFRRYFHLLPILGASFLPIEWAVPLAFFLGSGYIIMLGKMIYALRSERNHFRQELTGLVLLFLIAISVTILGLSLPVVSIQLFYKLYAIAIGMAMFIFCLALLHKPNLANDVSERAHAAYAISTLKSVDTGQLKVQLEKLMSNDKLYIDPDFNLKAVALRLNISTHQASELINTYMGKGFSRWVREYRVDAAKHMLLEEPSASVLSVALSVGFTAQSNFYSAFGEITGTTPARYRSLHLPS